MSTWRRLVGRMGVWLGVLSGPSPFPTKGKQVSSAPQPISSSMEGYGLGGKLASCPGLLGTSSEIFKGGEAKTMNLVGLQEDGGVGGDGKHCGSPSRSIHSTIRVCVDFLS